MFFVEATVFRGTHRGTVDAVGFGRWMWQGNRFRVQIAGLEGHFGDGVKDGGGEIGMNEVSGRFCPGDFGTGDQTEEIVTVLLLLLRDDGDDCC